MKMIYDKKIISLHNSTGQFIYDGDTLRLKNIKYDA